MNHGLTWHLEIRRWNEMKEKHLPDIVLATDIENFFRLEDVWQFLGFKLPKQRCGYAGIRNDVEYIVTRL